MTLALKILGCYFSADLRFIDGIYLFINLQSVKPYLTYLCRDLHFHLIPDS